MDLLPEFVEVAIERYNQYPNIEIKLEDITKTIHNYSDIDVVIALETCEHILEHKLGQLLVDIRKQNPKLVIISVPIEVGYPILLKNVGSFATGYVRHKEYTWKETLYAALNQTWKYKPHGTNHKGFDWKVLRHQIHQFIGTPKIIKMPNAILSTNTMFIVSQQDFVETNKESQYNILSKIRT